MEVLAEEGEGREKRFVSITKVAKLVSVARSHKKNVLCFFVLMPSAPGGSE